MKGGGLLSLGDLSPEIELAVRRTRTLRLAFAGGGTGGHLVPGLHLLAHLRERDSLPADLLWFTSGRAVERHVLAGISGTPMAVGMS